ncbi:MAG: hypothetical protein H7177_09230 [Rhizobacter sp.]|nr:hypothetical protein [Bacteriovorax sp.]
MKNLIILFSLILSACSGINFREPAQIKNSSLDEIFTIRSSKVPVDGPDLFTMADESLKIMVDAEFIEDLSLPLEKAFRIELVVDPVTYRLNQKIYYGPHSFHDKEAVEGLKNFTRNITYSKGMNAIFPYYEMYYNALRGHALSLKNFILLKNAPDINFPNRVNFFMESPGYADRVVEDNKMLPALEAQIKEENAKQKSLTASRKTLIAELDKLPDDQQLKSIIARGDRKEAAELIKKYLPWEQMAPFETKYWNTYLDVMENPAPLEERVLVYRGADGDFIHSAEGLSKEAAVKDGRAFYMSTLMTKNQGSWNRRLRSLETMYTKAIGEVAEGKDFATAVRMSALFTNHAGDPLGSPFLSFTPNVKIAMNFGRQTIASFLIDPRLLSYNYLGISEEAEFLMALTTFPDDMAGLLVYNDHHHTQYDPINFTKNFFNDKLTAKIEVQYGKEAAPDIVNKINKNSYNFFLNQYKPKIEGVAYLPEVIPGPSNLKYYNNLKEGALKPLLGPTGNLNCATMVQLFWKH